MQMLQPDFRVETNLSSQAFTLGDPAKMFSILADKIYSDKPRAIIRELACNALDACPDRPFKVSLPTHVDPVLSIRDYGPGLTKEKLFNHVTQFFWSDKTGTNDQIGGFGLGMKSPLSYTETFTIHSFQAGTKSSYIAFRDNTGIPQITEVASAATDEDDGLEICVPVMPADFYTFANTAKVTLRWFPEGSYELFGANPTPLEVLSETPLYRQVSSNEVNRSYVQMGPVAYEVDWTQTGIEIPRSIIPIFAVGELDLPPSRETLSYDARTVANLTARAQEIVSTYVADTLAEVPNLTKRERLLLLDNLKRSNLSPLFRKWRDDEGITEAERLARLEDRYITSEWGAYLKREDETVTIQAPRTRRFYTSNRYRAKTILVKKYETVDEINFSSVSDLDARHYYFADVTDKVFERLIDIGRKSGSMVIYDAAAWAELEDLVDPQYLHMLSEGDAPYVPARKSPARYYRLHYGSWEENFGPLPTTGFYLAYEGTRPPSTYTVNDYSFPDQVYAFNRGAQARIKGKLKPAFEFLEERSKELRATPAFKARNVLNKLENNSLFNFLRRTNLQVLTALQDRIISVTEVAEQISRNEFQMCLRFTNAEDFPYEDPFKLEEALLKAEKRNPLLMLILDKPHEYYNNPLLAKVVK